MTVDSLLPASPIYRDPSFRLQAQLAWDLFRTMPRRTEALAQTLRLEESAAFQTVERLYMSLGEAQPSTRIIPVNYGTGRVYGDGLTWGQATLGSLFQTSVPGVFGCPAISFPQTGVLWAEGVDYTISDQVLLSRQDPQTVGGRVQTEDGTYETPMVLHGARQANPWLSSVKQWLNAYQSDPDRLLGECRALRSCLQGEGQIPRIKQALLATTGYPYATVAGTVQAVSTQTVVTSAEVVAYPVGPCAWMPGQAVAPGDCPVAGVRVWASADTDFSGIADVASYIELTSADLLDTCVLTGAVRIPMAGQTPTVDSEGAVTLSLTGAGPDVAALLSLWNTTDSTGQSPVVRALFGGDAPPQTPFQPPAVPSLGLALLNYVYGPSLLVLQVPGQLSSGQLQALDMVRAYLPPTSVLWACQAGILSPVTRLS